MLSVEILRELSETDKDTDLKILNYMGQEKDKYSKFRGIIVDKESKMICPSFGHLEEKKIDDIKDLENLENWRFFPSYEGTLVRLYYHNESWRLSTHKKLSAFKSRWASRYSFGDIFLKNIKYIYNINLSDDNIFKWFTNQLDKETIYFFLLRSNNQNRIICNVELNKKERCLLMAIYKNSNFILNTENFIFEIDILNEFLKMKEIRTDNLEKKLESINPFEYQGIVGFYNKEIKVIKILSKKYKEWMEIRGNNPNLRFRYLELRTEPEKLEKLYYLYPMYSQMFDDLDEILNKISRDIYQKYIYRYIKKQYITVPNEEYNIMKKCHRWYLEDKENNKIFSKRVLYFIDNLSTILKIKLINNYYKSQNCFQKLILDNIEN